MDEEKVMEVLRQVEWGPSWYIGPSFCPLCAELKSQGHADDCKLGALLREAEGNAEASR